MRGTLAELAETFHVVGSIRPRYARRRTPKAPDAECPVGVMTADARRRCCARWFLRPKGELMTVAELKRKLRNSPFASLGVRIAGA
jgi:hypothetical protein